VQASRQAACLTARAWLYRRGGGGGTGPVMMVLGIAITFFDGEVAVRLGVRLGREVDD